jgi:LPS export ABC transporter protein LptC
VRLPGVVTVLLVLGGCSLDYGKEQTTPPDQVPQLVFSELKQTGVRDDRTLYTMESASAEVYQAKKQMRLKSFRFQEYDSLGAPASQGEAEAAVVDTASNDATISGRLTARSDEQKVTLVVDGGTAGGLAWANDDRILRTAPQTDVRLTKDDGSTIEAQGLTLDLGSNQMQLEGNVRGTWTPETNHDAHAPTTSPSPSPTPPPGPPGPGPHP